MLRRLTLLSCLLLAACGSVPVADGILPAELSRVLAASADRADLERFIAGWHLLLKRFAVLEVGYTGSTGRPMASRPARISATGW